MAFKTIRSYCTCIHLVTDNCMLHFPVGLNMGWMTCFISLVLTRVSSFAILVFLYLHGQLYLIFLSRVDVGLDDPENLCHLGHF